MKLTRTLGCCAMAMAMAMPTSALAQAQEETTITQRLITSTVTIGTTASVLLVRLYYGTQQQNEIDDLERKIKLYEQIVSIEHYITENPYALAEAVSIGAGHGLRDLATIMLVPDADYATWAREVRQEQRDIHHALRLHHEDVTQCAQQLHQVMTRALARAHDEEHHVHTTTSLLLGGAR